MSVKISVTKEDIEFAESILLPTGMTFIDEEKERINFISNFDTNDLNAVPGSGKTTALLAKLLILEKNLHFSDGSGVLVLSHTNAAVDEITRKIGPYCPKLFAYPNFVGTIQSFVNCMLAIPYYIQIMEKRIVVIDDDTYNWTIIERIKYHKTWDKEAGKRSNNDIINKAKNYLFANKITTKYRLSPENKLLTSINGKELEIKKPNSKKNNWTTEDKKLIYQWIIKLKMSLMMDGVLCFDDAYYLANRYIRNYPQVKRLLQKRFSYVFVDEMQDMALHQYKILEEIFYDKGNSTSVYQRIGDMNQAIYSSSDPNHEFVWKNRHQPMRLSKTYRLSKNIASVVENFAIDKCKITSTCQHQANIKPYLLVYDDSCYQCRVIQKFVDIVKRHQKNNEIPAMLEYPVKAISWVVNKKDDGQLTLSDYCPKLNRAKTQPKKDFQYLESYILNDSNDYGTIYNNILRVLLKILRIEGIKHEDRYFTKTRLTNYIREIGQRDYEQFKLNLYQWCSMIIRNEKLDAIKLIRNYTNSFLSLFGKEVDRSHEFINDNNTVEQEVPKEKEDYNCDLCKINGEKIEINSVHSVKGQTHTATLYLESFYHKDGKGENAKSYESQRLSEQFMNKVLVNAGKRQKMSAKMVYVGFSRPTHLLAFAVHRNRYEKYLSCIDANLWEIVLVNSNDGCE